MFVGVEIEGAPMMVSFAEYGPLALKVPVAACDAVSVVIPGLSSVNTFP